MSEKMEEESVEREWKQFKKVNEKVKSIMLQLIYLNNGIRRVITVFKVNSIPLQLCPNKRTGISIILNSSSLFLLF